MTNKLWGRVAFPALVMALASCAAPQIAPLQSTSGDRQPTSQSAKGMPGEVGVTDRHVMAQSTVSKGIPSTSRCYTLSTERVIFKTFRLDSNNRSDWDAKAESIADTCDNGSKVWDDLWYYYTLSTTENLLLVWTNIDKHEYGYVLVKNTPSVWLIYDNQGGPTVLANGKQYKKTWHSDGKRIDIDVFNPNNTGDWTSNDIWVSFGF